MKVCLCELDLIEKRQESLNELEFDLFVLAKRRSFDAGNHPKQQQLNGSPLTQLSPKTRCVELSLPIKLNTLEMEYPIKACFEYGKPSIISSRKPTPRPTRPTGENSFSDMTNSFVPQIPTTLILKFRSFLGTTPTIPTTTDSEGKK